MVAGGNVTPQTSFSLNRTTFVAKLPPWKLRKKKTQNTLSLVSSISTEMKLQPFSFFFPLSAVLKRDIGALHFRRAVSWDDHLMLIST